MGLITPEDIEAKKLLYRENEKHFVKEGFTYEIACKLFPIIQQNTWDVFGLFRYAKKIPDGGTYLELGSKWGGSLACVLYASQVAGHKIKMIAIDPQVLGKCMNFCKKHNVRFIRGYSHGVANRIKDNSIDFLFIDGLHSYTAVSRDLKCYWPKVKIGGFITGHDCTEECYYTKEFPGVVKAVQEFFGENHRVLPHSTIYVARKEIENEKAFTQASEKDTST